MARPREEATHTLATLQKEEPEWSSGGGSAPREPLSEVCILWLVVCLPAWALLVGLHGFMPELVGGSGTPLAPSSSEPWYAPGAFGLERVLELLTVVALLGVVLAAVVGGFVIAFGGDTLEGVVRGSMALHLALALCVACGTPFLALAAHRHVGEWARLKGVLRQTSEEVARARVRLKIAPGRLLTAEDVGALSREGALPRKEFKFSRLEGPVSLVLWRSPPYVAVDFHAGSPAVFDLVTMLPSPESPGGL